MSKKTLATTLAIASIFGSIMTSDGKGHIEETPYERPKGVEHRVRSKEEKALKKAHKKKVKAKRNAKKGIYENKIVYKKGKRLCQKMN